MDTYLDAHGAERCDNCGSTTSECVCACVECGDGVVECACSEGPAYPAVADYHRSDNDKGNA